MLEKSTGSNFSDIGHSNVFLNMFPDARETKSFCTAKETVNKTKRQPIEWEKLFANDISDKGVVSKTKKLYNSMPKNHK